MYTPRHMLCGGSDVTADKGCTAKYITPYVIRKRQWEQRTAQQSAPQPEYRRISPQRSIEIYDATSLHHSRFLTLFKKPLNGSADSSPLVTGSDFNLRLAGWRFKRCSAAGRNLWQDSQDLGFTLVTDPTSTARDMTPDSGSQKGRNTHYDLGSSHSIIEITLPHLTALTTRTREFAWGDSDAFRKHRTAEATPITDIES
ncbi:hypothetical protein HPB50_009389 [Hyalomma asiaticum]|uniref:Uncharacterized protein n=1 Tax=Hyalomma asiaticum TaxID=266040 RepID=A0ACB7SUU5_HYAAI|nr:hypothetical protein HPB50_009389 [Hyalomma asiaticum]